MGLGLLDGAAVVGALVGVSLSEGRPVGFGVGQPQQLHTVLPQSTRIGIFDGQTTTGTSGEHDMTPALFGLRLCNGTFSQIRSGTDPERSLLEVSRNSRLLRRAIAEGSEPVRRLSFARNAVSSVRTPISDGKEPSKLFL